ncbi:Protein ROS1 [Ananas comosus]|uniref:Protein ROS1 n=1 Tax=Ananas comosus TaxID=4615 RepID=A0A199UYP9_ANACO|nr:Protein ROS1 [Ananas comosus]
MELSRGLKIQQQQQQQQQQQEQQMGVEKQQQGGGWVLGTPAFVPSMGQQKLCDVAAACSSSSSSSSSSCLMPAAARAASQSGNQSQTHNAGGYLQTPSNFLVFSQHPLTTGNTLLPGGHNKGPTLAPNVIVAALSSNPSSSLPERRVRMDAASGSAPSPLAPITPDKSKSMPEPTQREHVSSAGAARDEEEHKKQQTGTPQCCAAVNADRSPTRPEAPITPDNGEGIPCLLAGKEGPLPHEGELHMHSSSASAQQLDDEKDPAKKSRAMSSDRTTGQKPRRKKHRPKVIREGEKTKTPKPSTLQAEETPVETAKRSHVGEKRGFDSDSDGARSVKRRLQFESEEGPTSTMTEAKFSGEEELTCTRAPASDKTGSTVLLGQGRQAGVANSPAGAMFDLNHSTQLLGSFKRPVLMENLTYLRRKLQNATSVESSSEYVRQSEPHILQKNVDTDSKNGVIYRRDNKNMTGAELDGVQLGSTQIQLPDKAPAEAHARFGEIYRRRRHRGEQCEHQKYNSREITSMEPQSSMANKLQAPEGILACVQGGRITKKRSIRPRKLFSIAINYSLNMFWPAHLKSPQSCLEALLASTSMKIKTKKRTKKGQAYVLTSGPSNTGQGDNTMIGNNFSKQSVEQTVLEEGFGERNMPFALITYVQDAESSNKAQELAQTSLTSGEIVPYVDPLEDIISNMKHLHLSTEQVHTIFDPGNALVPCGGSMIVPYENPLDLLKKRRPRAKVNLDNETNRVWKLLMGKKGIGPPEGVDIDKEKWWEQERQVFQGRADLFIKCMRLVQGDRHFSPWKGSVVDSVVGVFLTQNVSDHLSSSAFISLAARFPRQTKDSNTNQSAGEMGEPVSQDERNQVNNCKQSEGETREPVSQDERNQAFDDAKQRKNLSGSEMHHPDSSLTRDDKLMDKKGKASTSELAGGSVEAQKIIEPESVGLHAPLVTDIGLATQENRQDSSMQLSESTESEVNKMSQEELIASQTSVTSPESCIDFLIKTTDQSQDKLESIPQNDMTDTIVVLQSSISSPETTMECHIDANVRQQSRLDPKSKQEESSMSSTAYATKTCNLEVKDGDIRSSLETTGNEASDPMQGSQAHESSSNSCDHVNPKVPLAADYKEESSFQNVLPEMTINMIEQKRAKAATEKAQSFDWDSLRRLACSEGYKNERNPERNDSLDWEAVLRADVNEVSHAIRERGMNNVLAERIKGFLNRLVNDHGSIDLEWLRYVPPDKVKDYLLSIRGLGLKSVECVRLLTLHHVAFPAGVGTTSTASGVSAIASSRTVGLLLFSVNIKICFMYYEACPRYPMLETIQRYLWPRLCQLDQETLYELHYQMITFGKVFCTKSKPNCNACPMRGDCKHFASAFASARLALPGPEERSSEAAANPADTHGENLAVYSLMPLPPADGSSYSRGVIVSNCEPIIEEPASPKEENADGLEREIEDAFYEDSDEIPTIKINLHEFTQNIEECIKESNNDLQTEDITKALVAITTEAASIPAPKLKNVSRLRTEHQVYLELEEREHGDVDQSAELPKTDSSSQCTSKSCNKEAGYECCRERENQAQYVKGTILIPCRTAMRGSFPLNGTYFQVNEVFADHHSSHNPIDVPRNWIWNLKRRTVYFGSSIPTIFRGFICVRGFERRTRAPRPLCAKLHLAASKVPKSKKVPPKEKS